MHHSQFEDLGSKYGDSEVCASLSEVPIKRHESDLDALKMISKLLTAQNLASLSFLCYMLDRVFFKL